MHRRSLTPDGRIAVCPGSYDPVTNGHLDIIERASTVFELVVVGVVNQPLRKSATLFSAEERKAFLLQATKNSATSRSRSLIRSSSILPASAVPGRW